MLETQKAARKMALVTAALVMMDGAKLLGHQAIQRMFGQRGGWKRGTGRRAYPEQSQRQAMRKWRRARGGPGIYFNQQLSMYLPRWCQTVEQFQQCRKEGVL